MKERINTAMPPTNKPVNGICKACKSPPKPLSVKAHKAVSRFKTVFVLE